jgi:flagellar protein FliO/FliZ
VDTLFLILRVGLSLTVVVVLLWMAQKRIAKGGRGGDEPVVNVVGRRSVGQRASVVVVESAGQRFLLGVTDHGINVLHTSDAPIPEPVTEEPGEPEFARALTHARRVRNRPAQGPLHGSIFARSTWVQAGTALRKGLNL